MRHRRVYRKTIKENASQSFRSHSIEPSFIRNAYRPMNPWIRCSASHLLFRLFYSFLPVSKFFPSSWLALRIQLSSQLPLPYPVRIDRMLIRPLISWLLRPSPYSLTCLSLVSAVRLYLDLVHFSFSFTHLFGGVGPITKRNTNEKKKKKLNQIKSSCQSVRCKVEISPLRNEVRKAKYKNTLPTWN